jgi:hypothetical protein
MPETPGNARDMTIQVERSFVPAIMVIGTRASQKPIGDATIGNSDGYSLP